MYEEVARIRVKDRLEVGVMVGMGDDGRVGELEGLADQFRIARLLKAESPSTVILEPQTVKSATVSRSICHEVMGWDAMIFIF